MARINIKKEFNKLIVVGILGWLLVFSLGSCRRINVGVEDRVYDTPLIASPSSSGISEGADYSSGQSDVEIMYNLAKDAKGIIDLMSSHQPSQVKKYLSFNDRIKRVCKVAGVAVGAGVAGALLFGVLEGESGYALCRSQQDNFSAGLPIYLNNIEIDFPTYISTLDPAFNDLYGEGEPQKCPFMQSLLLLLSELVESSKYNDVGHYLNRFYNSCSINTRLTVPSYISSMLQFCYEKGNNAFIPLIQNRLAELRNRCNNAILLLKSSSSTAEEMVVLDKTPDDYNSQLVKCHSVQSKILLIEKDYGRPFREHELVLFVNRLPRRFCPFPSWHREEGVLFLLEEFCYERIYIPMRDLYKNKWSEEKAICTRKFDQVMANQNRNDASSCFSPILIKGSVIVGMVVLGCMVTDYWLNRPSVQQAQEINACWECIENAYYSSKDHPNVEEMQKLEQLFNIMKESARAPMHPELKSAVLERLDRLLNTIIKIKIKSKKEEEPLYEGGIGSHIRVVALPQAGYHERLNSCVRLVRQTIKQLK